MEGFPVDMSDPDAIRDALDTATEKAETAREELARWETVRERLALLVRDFEPPPWAQTTAQGVVVASINNRGGPTRAADLAVLPALSHLERKTINWALWKAAKDKHIKKLSQGVYAPLAYETPQDSLPVSEGEPVKG
jgi:hypothetical protein